MSNSTNKSKTPLLVGGVVIAAAIVGGLILFTDVDLTQTAELPTVSVEGGQMPAMDVDVADVDVGTKTIEVEVPTVDVDLPKEGEEADDLADNIEIDVDADVDVDVKPDSKTRQ